MNTQAQVRELLYNESSLPFTQSELTTINPSLNPDDYRFIWREGNHSDDWWFENKYTGDRLGYGYTDQYDNSCFS